MRLMDYIKDNVIKIVVELLTLILIAIILSLFNINNYLIILLMIIIAISYLLCLLYDYLRKRSFYTNITNLVDKIDSKYLITELIKQPDFLEGRIILDCLYDIDKSYIDELSKYKTSINDFKDYINIHCHEIKTPIATANLIIENNKNKVTNSIREELDKIEYYVEQELFYSRSENLEKDCLIKKIDLEDIINTVIKRNKKDILTKKIHIINYVKNITIESDVKWLEYIINQIIINSIKYIKEDNTKPSITFDVEVFKNNQSLIITDNGIGIKEDEISRVFDVAFTGTNGRIKTKSTGMGLYLCKKMCTKLGHEIDVKSKEKEGTAVIITFPKNSTVDVINK